MRIELEAVCTEIRQDNGGVLATFDAYEHGEPCGAFVVEVDPSQHRVGDACLLTLSRKEDG